MRLLLSLHPSRFQAEGIQKEAIGGSTEAPRDFPRAFFEAAKPQQFDLPKDLQLQEAIAVRFEAIASRLEAIASMWMQILPDSCRISLLQILPTFCFPGYACCRVTRQQQRRCPKTVRNLEKVCVIVTSRDAGEE